MALKIRLSRLCAMDFAGEIPLHLALQTVAAEVRQRQEHAADETAPYVVAVVPVEVQVDGIVVLPAAPASVSRVGPGDIRRQQMHCHEQRQNQRSGDQQH